MESAAQTHRATKALLAKLTKACHFSRSSGSATRHGIALHTRLVEQSYATLCGSYRAKLSFSMATEISIAGAEDLKSRARELRRFL